jgi:hypothetical protein
VLLLGDHGRHEVIGDTSDERWIGHHLTSLYVWMPPALRRGGGWRSRHVATVASHVDVAPTVLALTALTPRVSPFVGKDLSCLIVADCGPDNRAALMTTHNAALVSNDRLLAYGIKNGVLREMDLALRHARDIHHPAGADAAELERLKGLIVASELLLDQNRLWSWPLFGPALTRATASPPSRRHRRRGAPRR